MTLVELDDIRRLAEPLKGQITRIFAHWSAGHYNQFFSDYHINIDFDGSIHISTTDFSERKAHTWRQNTGAIGIAIACAYQATSDDLGPEPPTNPQIESLAKVIKTLCDALGLSISYDTVRTHAEQADEDGYGPATTVERWDLAILRDGDEWMSGGDQIRSMAAAL